MAISVTLVNSFPSDGQMAYFKFEEIQENERTQCNDLAKAHAWRCTKEGPLALSIYAPYEKAKELFKTHFPQKSLVSHQTPEQLESYALHLSSPFSWALKYIQDPDEFEGYLVLIKKKAAESKGV